MGIRNVFFDVETNSRTPGNIVQLSFIVEHDGKIEYADNYFFKVDKMCKGAYDVHKLSIEDLKIKSNNKCFEDRYTEFLEYFLDSRIVSHNIKFDERFLKSELFKVGIRFEPKERLCTMEYFKDKLKCKDKVGRVKNPSVKDLIKYFGIKEDKIRSYSNELFGCSDVSYHDGRFDVTAIFIATNIYGEMLSGRAKWRSKFCV